MSMKLLQKAAWVTALLATLLEIQDHKNANFPGRDNSSLAVKSLIDNPIAINACKRIIM